jgi:DnaJ like chaperone protein
MGYLGWIAGGLGFALGGPIGGVIGFALGSLLDDAGTARIDPGRRVDGRRRQAGTTSGDLSMSLIVLSAAVMKADGKVTQSELGHVKAFFKRQFGAEQAKEMLLILRDVLKRPIPLRQVCMQIRQNTTHPVRLQMVHYLVGLASQGSAAALAEKQVIQQIAGYLGVSDRDLASMSAMFRKADTQSAYQILEIPKSASDDEVKKAYRRMAKKYHPDRVLEHSADFQKAAADKFRKVQEAYDRICADRGM